jgi:hypothetical protein
MNIDLAPFLAAIVDMEGGSYRIPYATLRSQQGEKVIALDLEDDGATIVLRLVDAEEVEIDESATDD